MDNYKITKIINEVNIIQKTLDNFNNVKYDRLELFPGSNPSLTYITLHKNVIDKVINTLKSHYESEKLSLEKKLQSEIGQPQSTKKTNAKD